MTEEILINVTPQETRVAVLDHGVIEELHIERTTHRGLVGNIYLGRVARVLPGMQSAFVEIGLDRAAFLHIADIWEYKNAAHSPDAPGKNAPKPIEHLIREGQSLMVQVIKDPIGTKGARLSTQISLAGRMLVHLPQDSHIGISQRIEDEAERTLLKDSLTKLLPPDAPHGGFIIRTLAEKATERELARDVEYLTKLWADIESRSKTTKSGTLLHQDLSLSERVLRDFANEETQRVLVDNAQSERALLDFAERYSPTLAERVQMHQGARPLFDMYGVEAEIEKALHRRVDLKSGGYLIFDQTEALTTIDVNTGGFVGGRSFDDTIFKTNLEAALAIARQLRLRNLGGIIIIDFIDMDLPEHRDAVLDALRTAVANDRTRLTINGFTHLGLVEMTRKRTRESLAHVLCEPCPTCQGRGEIKTAQSMCYEILRELMREAKQFNPREMKILAAPAVIELFLEDESAALAQISQDVGRPVSLQAEAGYSQEQYDIVLL
jgi:ribonuclease G